MTTRHERPCAAHGWNSYRYRGRYGWIMIGANSHDDALREAARSTVDITPDRLDVWDGERYVPSTGDQQ